LGVNGQASSIDIPLSKFSTQTYSDASPTKEAQANAIEEFTKRSMRNFRRFLSLQNEGSLTLPL